MTYPSHPRTYLLALVNLAEHGIRGEAETLRAVLAQLDEVQELRQRVALMEMQNAHEELAREIAMGVYGGS